MIGFITIGSRFCGPPHSGNGGYTCGLLAAYLDGPAEVTLRRPPPLDRPLQVERDDEGTIRLVDGDALIAEAAQAPELDLEDPVPIPLDEATAAGARSRFRLHPEEHPFPTCFVCGPDRSPGDGLGILVGPVSGRNELADVWQPEKTLAASDGQVRPEFVWAALDCSGGLGAIANASVKGPPFVLGRLAVRELAPVEVGEPHVVLGWRAAAEGRKLLAGSALLSASGRTVGMARATWIRLG